MPPNSKGRQRQCLCRNEALQQCETWVMEHFNVEIKRKDALGCVKQEGAACGDGSLCCHFTQQLSRS